MISSFYLIPAFFGFVFICLLFNVFDEERIQRENIKKKLMDLQINLLKKELDA